MINLEDPEDGLEALQRSVQIARAAGADYEVGLSLKAVADSAQLLAIDASEDEREAKEMFDRLGVVWPNSFFPTTASGVSKAPRERQHQ